MPEILAQIAPAVQPDADPGPSFADELVAAVDRGPYDSDWEAGYSLGLDGEEAVAPPHWPADRRNAWGLGFEAGCQRRWDEFHEWLDAHEAYLRAAGYYDDYATRAYPDELPSGYGGHQAWEG